MTLENTLLQKLAEWRPAAGRQTLTVTDAIAGSSVSITSDRQEGLGCAVWELALHRIAATGGETLQSWARRCEGPVAGLLEPLQVLEIDAERGEAILRSNDPSRRGEELHYYELLLKGTSEAVMRRYRMPRPNGRREQVAFTLTHEAAARLVGHLTRPN